MRHQQHFRGLARAVFADKMNVQPVHLGGEMVKAVQLIHCVLPAIFIDPIGAKISQPVLVHAIGPSIFFRLQLHLCGPDKIGNALLNGLLARFIGGNGKWFYAHNGLLIGQQSKSGRRFWQENL